MGSNCDDDNASCFLKQPYCVQQGGIKANSVLRRQLLSETPVSALLQAVIFNDNIDSRTAYITKSVTVLFCTYR